MICRTYEINQLQQYKYVVILSEYNGKILLSRHKERSTWETQGGHIEPGETPLEAAERELFEESGATAYDIRPLCDYWAGDAQTGADGNGMVFTAVIHTLGELPDSEMAEVRTFDQLPEQLTYEAITPVLFARMFYKDLLEEFIRITKETIGRQLTGIYLHGSMVMGCFHPQRSDIDLIIVIEQRITDIQKTEFMQHVVRLNEQAPEKGLELSIVQRKYCDPFLYPTPYELHFSPVHLQWFQEAPQDYVKKMNGEDRDLAAHFTVIRQYGTALYGEEIENVFAAVPDEYYIDSICMDMQNAQEDIFEQPVSVILNLCRVLAFLTEGLYLSKKEGGIWGMKYLPADHYALLADALECYASGRCMIIQPDAAQTFAKEMQKRISLTKDRYAQSVSCSAEK